MKRILLCLAFLGFIQGLSAQITITSNDLPSANDTLRFSIGSFDTLTLSIFENSDTNYLWDFSHLVAEGQDVASYKSSLQTPYAFFFLGLNRYGLEVIDTIGFGNFQFTDVYDFYRKTSTVFEAEGRGLKYQGLPVPSYYADNDEIYQFPLDYGDLDSSTFDFTTSLGFLASYQTSGQRINRVDGWGEIRTPYDTVQCIRVVTDIIATDSVSLGILTFGFPNVTREYKWLANGERFPMLEISGDYDWSDSTFTPNEIRYRDNYRAVSNSNSIFAPNGDFFASTTTPDMSVDTVTLFPLTLTHSSNNYTWNITPNTYSYVNGTYNGSQNPQVVFNATGDYDVSLNISNNFGTADTLKIDYITVGVSSTNELTTQFGLHLFPNPVGNLLNITYTLKAKKTVRLTIFDATGKLLYTDNFNNRLSGSHQHQIAFDYPKGAYFVNVWIGEQQQTYKVVK